MSTVKETMKSINKSLSKLKTGYSCTEVSWEDASRGTINDSLSCWGSNITDVRLWAKDGRSLYTVRSNNWNEKIGKIKANEIAIIQKDEIDGTLKPITLENYLKNISKYGAYCGIAPETSLYNEKLDNEISIRFQTTFLPVDTNEHSNIEFCPENYNYQTVDAKNPRNLLLLATTQGCALQQDGPGAQKLFHHSYNKDTGKIHRYWFECESSNHKVGGPQIETEEEIDDAIKRGKAVSAVIGTRQMSTRFNVLMTIQIPIMQNPIKPSRYSSSSAMKSFDLKPQKLFKSFAPVTQFFDLSCNDESKKFSNNESKKFSNDKSKKFSNFENEIKYLGCVGDCETESMQEEYDDEDKELSNFENEINYLDCSDNCELSDKNEKKKYKKIRNGNSKTGKATAGRVSRGTQYDDNWKGLNKTLPIRDPNQHITITCVIYNTVAGGIPSEDDVYAAINDLTTLYRGCEWNGHLADEQANFMKTELTIKAVNDISTKLITQPYNPPNIPIINGNVFPS